MSFRELAHRYRVLRSYPLLYTREEARRFARAEGRRKFT